MVYRYWCGNNTAVRIQKAVTANCGSKLLLPFDLADKTLKPRVLRVCVINWNTTHTEAHTVGTWIVKDKNNNAIGLVVYETSVKIGPIYPRNILFCICIIRGRTHYFAIAPRVSLRHYKRKYLEYSSTHGNM